MPLLIAAAVAAAATWDGWRWYLGRLAASPEEGLALALTVLFLAGLGWTRRAEASRVDPIAAARGLLPATLALAAYAAGFFFLPPIVRAAIAVGTTLHLLLAAAFGGRAPPAFWGLVALSMPVVPSLQFVLGFPMRAVAATLSVGLLRAQGLDVVREGTLLVWQDRQVQFDAPCSGVNMLWAALVMTLMAALLLRLDTGKTLLAVALAALVTIAANGLRGAALFHMETGFVAGLPSWAHEGVGLALFLLSAILVLSAAARLAPRSSAP